MTCIVGLIHKGLVYIGGDSAGTAHYSQMIRADEKVFINKSLKNENDFIIGFTSSFRMGQLLRYKFEPPEQKTKDDYEYMVTDFVDELRKCFKDNGYAKINNNEESGGTFLVGYKSKIYEIENDYQVAIPLENFASVGSGSDIALGCLYTTKNNNDPIYRTRKALEASEKFNAAVRSPFKILSI